MIRKGQTFCKCCYKTIVGSITHVQRHAKTQTHKCRLISSRKGTQKKTLSDSEGVVKVEETSTIVPKVEVKSESIKEEEEKKTACEEFESFGYVLALSLNLHFAGFWIFLFIIPFFFSFSQSLEMDQFQEAEPIIKQTLKTADGVTYLE